MVEQGTKGRQKRKIRPGMKPSEKRKILNNNYQTDIKKTPDIKQTPDYIKKGVILPLKLPVGIDPLANSIGKKIKAIRLGRGLTIYDAANQLGISCYWYSQIEDGLYVPTRWLGERIWKWASEGKTFSEKNMTDRKDTLVSKGFDTFRMNLHKTIRDRLQKVCSRTGITQHEFAEIAIERLLDSPNEIATYETCAERFNKARISQALADSPEVKLFLQLELKLLIDRGMIKIEDAPEKHINPVIKLAELQTPTLEQTFEEEYEDLS
jgi:DNA-binding XRE family transcriptional regulator